MSTMAGTEYRLSITPAGDKTHAIDTRVLYGWVALCGARLVREIGVASEPLNNFEARPLVTCARCRRHL